MSPATLGAGGPDFLIGIETNPVVLDVQHSGGEGRISFGFSKLFTDAAVQRFRV